LSDSKNIGELLENMKDSSDEEYNPEKYYINLKNVRLIKEDKKC
jgi:hypothetical protein